MVDCLMDKSHHQNDFHIYHQQDMNSGFLANLSEQQRAHWLAVVAGNIPGAFLNTGRRGFIWPSIYTSYIILPCRVPWASHQLVTQAHTLLVTPVTSSSAGGTQSTWLLYTCVVRGPWHICIMVCGHDGPSMVCCSYH